MFAFVVFDLVSQYTKRRDWLGRTSSKWPIVCVGWDVNLNSINQ